jgi:RNA polymerase primary sigma factor
MAPAEPRLSQVPPHLIERINALVRTSQRMLTEIGREPTLDEVAERLAMPVEKVRRLLEVARAPINLRVAGSGE